jgi:hypothetical protein
LIYFWLDYIESEILQGFDHSLFVDRWSSGVFMYTIITVQPSFEADDKDSLFRSISLDEVFFKYGIYYSF